MSIDSLPLDDLDNFTAAPHHPMAPGGYSALLKDDLVRHRLQTIRDNCGLTQRAVAEDLQWNLSKVIRVENGNVKLSLDDVKLLLWHYGVTQEVADPIIATVRANRAGGQEHTPYRPILSHEHRRCLGYEAIAKSVRFYKTHAFPDILLTTRYAQDYDAKFYPNYSPGDIELVRRLRSGRAAYLLGKNGPPAQIIVFEAAFHRWHDELPIIINGLKALNTAGGRRAATSQLNPNVNIQVQPFTNGRLLSRRYDDFSIFDVDGLPHPIVYGYVLTKGHTSLNPSLMEPAAQQRVLEQLSDTLPPAEETNDILDDIHTRLRRPSSQDHPPSQQQR